MVYIDDSLCEPLAKYDTIKIARLCLLSPKIRM